MLLEIGQCVFGGAFAGEDEEDGFADLLPFLQDCRFADKFFSFGVGKCLRIPVFDFTDQGIVLSVSPGKDVNPYILFIRTCGFVRPDVFVFHKVKIFRQIVGDRGEQFRLLMGMQPELVDNDKLR